MGEAAPGYDPEYEVKAIMKCRAVRKRRAHWEEEEPRIVADLTAAVDAVLATSTSAAGGLTPNVVSGSAAASSIGGLTPDVVSGSAAVSSTAPGGLPPSQISGPHDPEI